MIYDVEQYIDYDRIKEILDKNINKKIICFGGGTASEILTKNLLYQYDVEYYLDNNNELWNSNINNIPIKNPEILKDMKKGSFIVLILSKHVINISKQLTSYGLVENTDFFDIYEKFKKYFRIAKFDELTERFKNFIDTIPNEAFNNIKVKDNQKIGIVCISSTLDLETWYPFAQYLILKYKGYNVTLIIDNLKSFDDISYFDGSYIVTKKYCEYIINYIKNKFGELNISYIKENEKEDLDEKDIQEIKRLRDINIKWYSSRIDEMKGYSDTEREKIFYNILERNAKVLKYYFNNNKYDVINVFTALHKHRGLYMWEGLKHNIRVSSYDNGLYSTNNPCSHLYDINKIIDGNWFTNEELYKIKEMAYKNFEERINGLDNNFQISKKETISSFKDYDIVIPLNIEWDAAALGLDRIFNNYSEWLLETIDFIICNTNASVLIREHPAQIFYKDYIYKSYENIIKEKYPNNNRLYYCKSNENINTYKIIEKSKIVLPYSSFLGVESVLMNKLVISHTKAFFDNMNFIYSAKDKDDYFILIDNALNNKLELKNKDTALLTYYYMINNRTSSDFREFLWSWLDRIFDELINDKDIIKLINVIANDIPLIYSNIKENLNNSY